MIEYFTDPVLAAPTIGCMLMCVLAAFIGTFSVLLRRSLVGEAISHASYPGVLVGLILTKFFVENPSDWHYLLFPLAGATLSSLIGIFCIQKLISRRNIHPDSALTFVLASFFGLALLLLSAVQTEYPTLYREMQAYLFGQAATQRNLHLVLYTIIISIALIGSFLLYRPIKIVIFDPEYAKTVGIPRRGVYLFIWGVTVVSVVIGIRSLGVVLMSSMLIFPSVTSRLWTSKLEYVLLGASLFGLFSGFFGVFFAHEMSGSLSFPTGPMVVVAASILFLFSTLFSPRCGLIFRFFRKLQFKRRCHLENLLKKVWKNPGSRLSSSERRALEKRGWIKSVDNKVQLTPAGLLWGKKILRLHRLWEVYLVEYCEVGKERAHPSAEEMEHIITPEIEKKLEEVLGS